MPGLAPAVIRRRDLFHGLPSILAENARDEPRSGSGTRGHRRRGAWRHSFSRARLRQGTRPRPLRAVADDVAIDQVDHVPDEVRGLVADRSRLFETEISSAPGRCTCGAPSQASARDRASGPCWAAAALSAPALTQLHLGGRPDNVPDSVNASSMPPSSSLAATSTTHERPAACGLNLTARFKATVGLVAPLAVTVVSASADRSCCALRRSST